jgi:hypothetical protein
MDTIMISLSAAYDIQPEIQHCPPLTSKNKLVSKGIGILGQTTPGVLRYLSKQRVLAHLADHPIEIQLDKEMPEADVRRRLGSWMQRKRTRRLVYVILELLLMPFTAFVALLPGPNVVFYGLFVLFYFHFKAFLSLSRIKVEELNITIIRGA